MYRRLHDQFGTAGMILSVVAIVLALTGGAIAANSGKPGPRGKTGKTGKPGPAGPAGTNGTNGTNGKDGAPGSAGTNGVSVTTSAAGVGECPEGGVKLTAANGNSKVCNGEAGTPGDPGTNGKSVLHGTGVPAAGLGNEGEFYIDTAADEIYGPKVGTNWGPGTQLEGSPWTAGGTLPQGSTETGSWVYNDTPAPLQSVSISYAIPLAAELNESHVHYIEAGETPPSGCTGGTAAEPTADPGFLCIYESSLPLLYSTLKVGPPSSITKPGQALDVTGGGSGTTGAIISWFQEEKIGAGSWAVTAG